MKKVSLLVFSIIFSIGSLLAQKKPSFGFKVGANFVNLNSASDVSLGHSFSDNGTTGFHAGIVLHVPFVKKSGFQAEAFYSAEGIKDLDLAYVNMPIMYTYKILPGFRLQLGPQFRVKVNAKVDENGVYADTEETIEDDLKGFNFDAAAGLEFRFPIIGIFIQGRTVFGLNDIGDDFFGKSQAVQLSVGYRF